MIPILYEIDEVSFTSNGIGRLRDCISCIVTEERNGIYECDFEYPVNGANFELIQIGRIIGVTHDDTGDVQPFDIVSFTKPIDGIVTFHCVHISYRLRYYTITGVVPGAVYSASSFVSIFRYHSVPTNPFHMNFEYDKQGFVAAVDGLPHSVRELLGGMEGSVLDSYGGEYEFDKFDVNWYESRGIDRDFSIRYGVNMLEYTDETDSDGTYSSCVPYWVNGDVYVVGNRVTANNETVTGRGECIPLDLTDKFETKPTKTALQNAAKSYMNSNQTYLSGQTINVSFVLLQDLGEYADYQNLLQCCLCDTINVIFPDYQTQARFKIVKTVWNVLTGRYDEMELGTLSVSLSEALGISNRTDNLPNQFNSISVDGDIALGGKITSFYKIVEVEVSVAAVSAHSYSNLGTQTVPSGDRPSGMVLVGTVGYQCGNYRIVPYNYYVNGTHTFTLAMVNTTAAASAATTFTAKLLYMKATSA